MDKVITRFSIVIVTIYFIISYLFAQFGMDILSREYTILFELCVVTYTFCSGKFHCKYIRWTGLSLLFVDVLNYTDYYFNYIPTSVYNIIPIGILALGITTSITLAFRHFYKVNKIKRLRQKNG